MACFSVLCNNGVFSSQEKAGIYGGKTKCLRRYTSVCYTSFCFPKVGFYNRYKNPQHSLLCINSLSYLNGGKFGYPLLGFCACCEYQHGLSSSSKIRALISGNGENIEPHLRKRGNHSSLRRKFSLRLRPRLRLLTIRLKKNVQVRSMLNNFGTFLRKNTRKATLSALISVALGICYLFVKLASLPLPKIVPYSDLVTSLESGCVTKVLIEEGSRRIYYNTNMENRDGNKNVEEKSQQQNDPTENIAEEVGTNKGEGNGETKVNVWKRFSRKRSSRPEWQFSTRKIDHDEKFLLSLLREKGTIYSSAPQSVLTAMRSTLITIICLWIPLTPLMWLLYRQLAAANSPAKKRRPNSQMVGFDDVEGVDAAKVELMEVVLCLQGAINYQKLGAKLPRGVLLVGPPGTGKTLLARAVAGEAGVPFFSVSASEFVEMFVGRGAARIRDLFNVARKSSPSIIFIDELDAVGGKRGRSFNDERDQTLNQLLTEMDGFESDTKVVVIAATNRPEALDPALCRPGRFSRKVVVGEPDEEGRRKIMAVHLRGVPLEEDLDVICDLVASLTPGFVGADLANIVNESALLAARRGGEIVTREDIMEALERAKFGINDRQLKPSTISKELGKLFPWMPSLVRRNDTNSEGPLGYQTLS